MAYLGEKSVKIKDTPFTNYTPTDWALYFIGMYGQIDGAHHKLWVLDQVARILHGTPIKIKIASWTDKPSKYRVDIGRPTKEYKNWVKEQRGEYDPEEEDYEYGYDEGIAP